MRTLYIGLLCVLLSACTHTSNESHYFFDLEIEPANESLTNSIRLNYKHSSIATDTLNFYLHKNLEIEYVNAAMIDHWLISESDIRYMPEAHKISFILKEPIQKNEFLKLEMKYSGKIGIVQPWKTNRITTDWIELGNYSPWFLYAPDFKNFAFEGYLKIDSNYKIASNAFVKLDDDQYNLRSFSKHNDIVITASKALKSKSSTKERLVLSHFNLSQEIVDDILNSGIEILTTYDQWFGATAQMTTNLIVSPRTHGGGYARKGLICLSNFNDKSYRDRKSSYIRYFAHEMAHLWWFKADSNTWEDWLNESFAEYTALMIIRNMFGVEEFERRIASKRDKLEELPPIYDLDRDHKMAYEVLYNKGPIVLNNLEKRIGKDRFLTILNSMYKENISSTDQLLILTKSLLNKQEQETFKRDIYAF